ncbi:MAG: XdhC family aldehyde oxidoreductase maturation factor [Deltaproteobacteria bacterium]|jgi:xanthine dehydrogenase accessory factor
MRKWVSAVNETLSRKQPLVMALIMSQEGSTPRTAGTRMMIGADGYVGTIGGGRIEASVMETAREMLHKPGAVTISFDLTSEIADAMDMVCGGKLEILIDSIAPNETNRLFFSGLLQMLDQRQKGLMVTELLESGVLQVKRAILREDGVVIGTPDFKMEIDSIPKKLHAPILIQSSDRRFFIEPVMAPGTVYLFGAGHVSLQTAILAKRVGFEVVVLDDRMEFANTSRFSDADDVRVPASFEIAFEGLEIHADSYLVILTRGHLHDKTVLQQALKTPAGYIGMIGSRKKRDAIYQALENDGFTAKDFQKVHCPIGLSIGAQTPEEIAVSIVAELIHARSVK